MNAQLQPLLQLVFEHELARQQKLAFEFVQLAWQEPPSQWMPPLPPDPQTPVPEHVTLVVGAETKTPSEHAPAWLHRTSTLPPAFTVTLPQVSVALHLIDVAPPAFARTPPFLQAWNCVHAIEQVSEAVHVTPSMHVGSNDGLAMQSTSHVPAAQVTPRGQEPGPEHWTSHFPASH